MHLTPQIICAAYALLRECPPFRRWNLPKPEHVGFRVMAEKHRMGSCFYLGRKPNGHFIISVSAAKVSHMDTLIETMAHEMCHVRADSQGEKSEHGRLWRAAAAQAAKHHGFDGKGI